MNMKRRTIKAGPRIGGAASSRWLRKQPARARRGFCAGGMTLMELIVVIAILAILAGAVIPLLNGIVAKSRITAVRASLSTVREAIVGKGDSPGFQSDVGRPPNSIAELLATSPPSGVALFNRDTNIGWRGPYLISQGGLYPIANATFTNLFGNNTSGNQDPALLDPWGDPIIIQRLTVASGVLTFIAQNGTPQTASTTLADGDYTRVISGGPNKALETAWTDPTPTTASRGDDILLFLNRSDPYASP
jgi:prepilin-type N-terminal cleavage/methylation domain-containing protein